ncbi:MAG: hypothetical protein AAF587_37410 [Bacteroidota bacterium]
MENRQVNSEQKLRQLFASVKEEDRQSIPSFREMWTEVKKEKARKQMKTRRWKWSSIAASVLLLIGVGGYWWDQELPLNPFSETLIGAQRIVSWTSPTANLLHTSSHLDGISYGFPHSLSEWKSPTDQGLTQQIFTQNEQQDVP